MASTHGMNETETQRCQQCDGQLSEFNIENDHKLCQECANGRKQEMYRKCASDDCNFQLQRDRNGKFPDKCYRCEGLDFLAEGKQHLEFLRERGIEINPNLTTKLAEAEDHFDHGRFRDVVVTMRQFNTVRVNIKLEVRFQQWQTYYVKPNEAGNPDPNLLTPDAREQYDLVIETMTQERHRDAYQAMDRMADIVEQMWRQENEERQVEENRRLREQRYQSPSLSKIVPINGAFGRGKR